MNKLTREWVRKAEADVTMAQLGAAADRPPRDAVCFHCQQAAEKYLKAILQESGLPITRTHDLEILLAALVLHFPSLRRLRRGLTFLTGFAVETRYPGKTTSKRQMGAALRWAERVRQECRALLGLK
jgi:HEPN domain-containing protein